MSDLVPKGKFVLRQITPQDPQWRNLQPQETFRQFSDANSQPANRSTVSVKEGTVSPFQLSLVSIPTTQNGTGTVKRILFKDKDSIVSPVVPIKKSCLEVNKVQSTDTMGQPQRPSRRNKADSNNNSGNNNTKKKVNIQSSEAQGSDTPALGDSECSDSEAPPSSPPRIQKPMLQRKEGVSFEDFVQTALGQLATNSAVMLDTLLGDAKVNKQGVVTRLSTVEEEIYGSKQKSGRKGLKQRVTDLESKVKVKSVAPVSDAVKESVNENLKKEVDLLRASNKMLVGATSKLQRNNRTLQNQLYIHQDRTNYLNLHLGGVAQLEDSSCKKEAVAFFKDILGIETTERDFIKAHRKTMPNEYTENVKDGDNYMKLKVKAPGIMFVRMGSEYLRELAMQKARGLGGRRHPTLNHKYFVSEMKCEAVRASREQNQPRIKTILEKNEREGRNDTFYFHGEEFYVNGKIQREKIQVPMYAEINYSLLNEQHILDMINLYEMEEPFVKDGNEFYTYAVKTARPDVVRWAYIKVYAMFLDAAHVMMAYKFNKRQGNCDDEEHKGGYTLLRVIQRKKLRNVAVFIVRKFTSDHHRLGPKRFNIFTTEAESMLDFVEGSASRNEDENIPQAPPEVLSQLQNSQDSSPGSSQNSSQGSSP